MKQETALKHLRAMMILIQKMRANANDPFIGIVDQNPDEVGLPITKELLASIMPWVFDDSQCPLPALSRIIDRAETTGILAPMDYFNMMTIFFRLMPELVMIAPITIGDVLPTEPISPTTYIGGWE